MTIRTMNRYPGPWSRIIGGILLLEVCISLAFAGLPPGESCPDSMNEELAADQARLQAADEANASILSDQMMEKYCRWAAQGDCFLFDTTECSRYGVYLPGFSLTTETGYVVQDNEPGILILFGAWNTAGNTTTPAARTDIDIRIRENGTQRYLTHKTLTTGDDGQFLFEWIWGTSRNDWDKDWIMEYSHDETSGQISFYSETEDLSDFEDDAALLEEFPDTTLYQMPR